MESTQVLFSESFEDINTVTEKCPVATLEIDGVYHTIYNKENVIGREDSCDIVIKNNAVSSKHATIEADDPDYHVVYDMGSTNKTRLGKVVLKPFVRHKISDGDCLMFGNISARYNISRQYPVTPEKAKSNTATQSIPETPERPDPPGEISIGNLKNKSDDYLLNASDPDMFDEKGSDFLEDEKRTNQKEVSNSSDDIYQIDTLSFDDTLNPCQNDKKQNVPEVNSFENDMLEINQKEGDVSVYDVNTQEPVIENDKSIFNEPKIEKNDTEAFADMTTVKTDLSINISSGCNEMSTIGNNFETATNKKLLSNDLEKIECTKSAENLKSKTAEKHEIANSYSGAENDLDFPLSQNTDMFASPEKSKYNDTESDDVYEMLTQVSNADEKLDESIYDMQTQPAPVYKANVVSTSDKDVEDNFLLPHDETLSSTIIEAATQPFEANSNDKVKRDSCMSTNVVDESDQNLSSICELPTQQFPLDSEAKSKVILQDNSDEKTNAHSVSSTIKGVNRRDQNSDLNFQASTQSFLQTEDEETSLKIDDSFVRKDPKLEDDFSTKVIDETDLTYTLSTSVLETATQRFSKEQVKENTDTTNCDFEASCDSDVFKLVTEPLTRTRVSEEKNTPKVVSSHQIIDTMNTSTSNSTLNNQALVLQRSSSIPCEEETKVSHQLELDAAKEDDKDYSLPTSHEVCATQPHTPIEKTRKFGDESDKSFNEKIVQGICSSKAVDETNADCTFSTSFYEAATQPLPRVSVGNTEVIVPENEKEHNDLSTSFCELATQPLPQTAINKESLIADEKVEQVYGSDHLPATIAEADKDSVFSTSIYKVATEPLTKVSVQKMEVIIDENEKEQHNNLSTSFCELATQPFPQTAINKESLIADEKMEQIYGSDHLPATVAEADKDIVFSTTFYEAATQPLPKVSVEKTEVIIDDNEKEQHNNLSTSFCELATQPLPQTAINKEILIADEKIEQVDDRSHLPETVVEADKDSTFSTTFYEVATQPLPKVSVEKTEVIVAENEKEQHNNLSTSFCELATQPLPQTAVNKESLIADENVEQVDDSGHLPAAVAESNKDRVSVEKKEAIIAENENDQLNELSTSFYEVATQPMLKTAINKESLIADEKVEQVDDRSRLPETVVEVDKDSTFSTTFYEVATQPVSKVSVEKTEVIVAENEKEQHNNLSTSFCELATQPLPQTTVNKESLIADENVEQVDDSSHLPAAVTESNKDRFSVEKTEAIIAENENDQLNELSTSFYEAATQPMPKTAINKESLIADEKVEQVDDSGHLPATVTEGDKNCTFSTSLYEAETQPFIQNICQKEVSDDLTEALTQPVPICKADVTKSEGTSSLSAKNSDMKKSLVQDDLHEEVESDVLNRKKSPPNAEQEDELQLTFSGSFYEAATQQLPPQPNIKEQEDKKERKDDSFNQAKHSDCSNIPSEDICEVATQQLSSFNKTNKHSTDEQNEHHSEKQQKLDNPQDLNETVIIQNNKAGNNLSISDLPNTLSDSFFDSATKPYNTSVGERNFIDPLSSICNDLSEDKIGEFSEKIMNISAKSDLLSSNELSVNKNIEKTLKEGKLSSELSDHNIYEAVNQASLHTKQKSNVDINTSKSSNKIEKLSTQDLKRILECDDFTQKYDIREINDLPSESNQKIQKTVLNDSKESGNSSNTKEPAAKRIDVLIDKPLINRDEELSQEPFFRSNKKRHNVFPPDSEDSNSKISENENSQEFNFRSNKKRAAIFPPDTQDFEGEISDSSQEIIIRSNKKRSNFFPPDTEDINSKPLQSGTLNFMHYENNIKNDVSDTNKNEDIDKSPKALSKTLSERAPDDTQITEMSKNIPEIAGDKKLEISKDEVKGPESLEIDEDENKGDKRLETNKDKGTEDKILEENKQTTKVQKGKGAKQIRLSRKGTKESRSLSPPERDQILVSRGNITVHSPEVLSELEEQFRLIKVEMSPTSLSVCSDNGDDGITSSQELSQTPQSTRKSARNKKSVSFKGVKKDAISNDLMKPKPSVKLNEKESISKQRKTDEINLAYESTTSDQKSVKKFKKIITPPKTNLRTSLNETFEENDSQEVSANDLNSDNSQNSEELGRGKRKRIRPSFEGFILEEEKKRISRKKLSFSQEIEDESLNASPTKKSDALQTQKQNFNDSLKSLEKKSVSVVLYDIQKIPSEIPQQSQTKVIKSTSNEKSDSSVFTKPKSPEKTGNKSKILPSKDTSQGKRKSDECKENKSLSFSFTEKLDELFDIWGPADRVKLSPRVAKKSYKLMAQGKNEDDSSPSTKVATKQSNEKVSSKNLDTKPTRNSAGNKKHSKDSFESASTSNNSELETKSTSGNITSRRKRSLAQKDEKIESSSGFEVKKKKRSSSENSENLLGVETKTSEEKSTYSVRKSSRNMTKNEDKSTNIPSSEEIPSRNKGQAKRSSKEKFTDNKSIENTNESNSSSKPLEVEFKASKPTTVKNFAKRNIKQNSQKRKGPPLVEEPSTSDISDFACSQEFSFHESKVSKQQIPLPPPLKVRRSARKRNNENVADKKVENVMFTGIADKKTKALVDTLGGQIVDSPFTCTVLVSDKVRRTTKFLSALSRGLPIVSPKWLTESKENGRFIDVDEFLLTDKESEKMYSFNLKHSIEKAQNSKILEGWSVFVTPSVKPSPEEMRSIVECSGGRFLSKELSRWPPNSLIVSCDEDCAKWNKFSRKGKFPAIVQSEAILSGVLRQELDINSHRLL